MCTPCIAFVPVYTQVEAAAVRFCDPTLVAALMAHAAAAFGEAEAAATAAAPADAEALAQHAMLGLANAMSHECGRRALLAVDGAAPTLVRWAFAQAEPHSSNGAGRPWPSAYSDARGVGGSGAAGGYVHSGYGSDSDSLWSARSNGSSSSAHSYAQSSLGANLRTWGITGSRPAELLLSGKAHELLLNCHLALANLSSDADGCAALLGTVGAAPLASVLASPNARLARCTTRLVANLAAEVGFQPWLLDRERLVVLYRVEALLRSRDVVTVRNAALTLHNVCAASAPGRSTVLSIPGAVGRLAALVGSDDVLTASYARAAVAMLDPGLADAYAGREQRRSRPHVPRT